ncbi:Sua5/YciO/YrdC family protein [Oceaniovalibus guishaninsula JLT2003]|uniref:Threonylcarbamoyl-AMP synthase n=1 Tax=Oceaniovalibus guishaninsula JLT2003 TaxID=1231392 RepID=K2H7Y4_9RHOB|nr:L-threonylcarbamoyladenylate synthase [Oceaniovalibus guishaninsula]EKE43733.1 Sua5/YciO/YrdC family protein [Oceaniovalibus guishaninsula JLT2003]
MTERLAADADGIARAASLLRGGGLVAFPTETVYGLGADARSDRAVAAIFAAKDRPRFNPLIVHLPQMDAAHDLATLNGEADRLARAFWPGPLTLVLPLRTGAGLSPLVTAGLATVALRVPAAPLARDLLARAGIPVAAPSANPSGRVSAVTADHVLRGLGGRIDAVLDGGPCPVGVESTILAVTDEGTRLLRPGGLPVEAVEACLGASLLPPEKTHRPNAPGQLASHYAPAGRLRMNVTDPERDEVLLAFGGTGGDLDLSPTGDLAEAAANLFRHLQELDRRGAARIAVSPVPDRGLGLAINDRLRRAAAPRGSF